jgi:hypothetical protein
LRDRSARSSHNGHHLLGRGADVIYSIHFEKQFKNDAPLTSLHPVIDRQFRQFVLIVVQRIFFDLTRELLARNLRNPACMFPGKMASHQGGPIGSFGYSFKVSIYENAISNFTSLCSHVNHMVLSCTAEN